MAWYGDPPGVGACVVPAFIFGGLMPTAICRVYTPEGFVIAADGRRINVGRLPMIENNVRKIFRITPGRMLAYSLAGQTGLGPDGTSETVFSFRTATNQAAREIHRAQPKTFDEYAKLLCEYLEHSLKAAIKTGRIARFDPNPEPSELGDTIAWVFLDGYYKRKASRAKLRFFHEDQRLRSDIIPEALNPGGAISYGSDKIIFEVFDGNNPHFAQYRYPKQPTSKIRLRQAIQIAKRSIRAYSNPEAARIDPSTQLSVGGYIHIAKVTPRHGFMWVIPPKKDAPRG
jgi:hypothetical protein